MVEVTLTPDGDHTVLVIEDRGLPLDQIATYGAGDQIHVEDLGRLPRRPGTLRRAVSLAGAAARLPRAGGTPQLSAFWNCSSRPITR